MASRVQWEMEAEARRAGWRSLSEGLERRARERRHAKLGETWEGEERRAGTGRREGEALA